MIKKLLFLLVFVFFVFYIGIKIENKIRIGLNNLKISKIEVVKNNIKDKNEKVMVSRVIDGDTIELSDKRIVRYIGMNTPEMTDNRSDVLCFAKMAKIENEKLVLGKTVEMEKDISDKDKYDRLLRYVWIDGKMVNQALILGGFTKVATYPPDIKHKELFVEAEKSANKIICNMI